MAEAAPEVVQDAPEVVADPGKKKRLLLFVTGALLAVLAAGGAGYYFLGHKPSAKVAEKLEHKPLTYVPMDMFTVNLRTSEQERYLQLTMNLAVADAAAADAVKQQTPAIRNRVLLLLSSKGVEELLTREGKEKLAADLATEIRTTIEGPGPTKGLEQVLFSAFVIQ